MGPYILLLIFIFPAVIATTDLLAFLIGGRRVVHYILLFLAEIGTFLVFPFLYISTLGDNDCCSSGAAFSPDHMTTIWALIIPCQVAYFYSSYRKRIATPILEILVNGLLLIAIILNIFITIQITEILAFVLGNMPIIMFSILVLAKNHRLFLEHAQNSEFDSRSGISRIAWKILNFSPILKFPIIFILCFPILFIIIALLLLVGQKPDSVIRAFTETYKQTFSQWDYKCANVTCPEGHYLCSVAAKGHANIVKPQRHGIRNGTRIICNRQLLISNAFEDLMQEKLPFLHRFIRKQYNKVGNLVHRYYGIFNNKLICDFIYLLMKPLEWLFLFILYTFDRKPENRIEKQYLSRLHREEIDKR